LKPYGDKFASNVSKKDEQKEIEELLRRPPRLGVGAPIPASTGTLGYESVKLKNKLTGRKRQREDEGPLNDTGEPSEDEEESRAVAIKKKTKLDPFAKGKGKKKNAAADSSELAVSVQNSVTEGQPNATELGDKAGEQAEKVPAEESHSHPPSPSASPKKRKKKKKKHNDTSLSPLISPSNTVDTPDSPAQPPKRSEPNTPILSPMSPKAKARPPTPLASPRKMTNPLPLLNLDGPPADSAGPSEPSTKKKRRRRKKKKSGAGVEE